MRQKDSFSEAPKKVSLLFHRSYQKKMSFYPWMVWYEKRRWGTVAESG